MGRNAVAGDGGRGGGIRVDDGNFSVTIPADLPSDATILHIREPFGAGAGAAGAIGDEARAGGGGSGGETVIADIDIVGLRLAGWSGSADIIVGDGGHGTRLPGEHGRPGEHTKATPKDYRIA